jgi:L-asparaginase II
MTTSQPVLELARAKVVEAVHFGSIAVVDSTGKLLHSWGDPRLIAFLRSSAKPFQILPFVERGGVEHFQYTQKELSISCASHETARIHLDTVREIQARIGVEERYLQCGPHLPGDADMFKTVVKQDIKPTANFNNCSGKHTAMLACAKMRGLPLENYLDPSHPIQQDILAVISEMCGIEKEDIELGVDGCSAPNFALPLFNAALGMARLCDPRGLNETRAVACKKVTAAMTAYPEMVANHGEFDTELMKAGAGKIVTKRGAEGFQIVGLMPGVYGENGVGIAMKIVDGDAAHMDNELVSSNRVRPAVAIEILRQLNALDESQLKALSGFGPSKELTNYAGLHTGESHPVFDLLA